MQKLSEYEQQAVTFLESNGLKFRATEYPADAQDAPGWAGDEKPIKTKAGPMSHGLRYRVTIWREGKPGRLAFDFWNSIKAREAIELCRGPHSAQDYKSKAAARDASPTAYDVLACISSDQYCSGDFEEWASDLGYDVDSRKARKFWKRCLKFALKMRAFFAPEELTQLSEIQ